MSIVSAYSGLDVEYQKHQEVGRFGRSKMSLGHMYAVCLDIESQNTEKWVFPTQLHVDR